MRAAKFLGVAPWELAERSDSWVWLYWSSILQEAEAEGQEAANERSSKDAPNA